MDDIQTALRPNPGLMSETPDAQQVEKAVQNYVAYRSAIGGTLHVIADTDHMPAELERKWWPEEPKWQGPAAKLRKQILDFIIPINRYVHPGAQLRLDIHMAKEPPPAAPSPNTVMAVASIDAKSGLASHEIGRGEDLETHPAASSVPFGLTLICRSIEKAGDPFTMELGQGGNLYRREILEMNQDAQWHADQNRAEGLGLPEFIGPGWPPPPLEGQKAMMGIGEAAAGAALATHFGHQRANEPLLPRVHFAMPGGARTVAELAAAAGGGDEEFFNKQREATAEFFKKKAEDDRRAQERSVEQLKQLNETAEKNKLEGERMVLTQRVEADLARVKEHMKEIARNPQASEELAALRIDEAELAGLPNAGPRSQFAILTSGLELSDAAEGALRERHKATAEAQGEQVRMSAEALAKGQENSANAAEAASAASFEAAKVAAVQAYFEKVQIPQGSRDYTGRLEPVGGPEAPEGGQELEAGTTLPMEGSVNAQGRVMSVAGVGLRSAEIGPESGDITEQGHEEPVGGEIQLREEEPENVMEGGIAEAGGIPENQPPQEGQVRTEGQTSGETTEENKAALIAEQAQALVEEEQLRGEAPKPPAAIAAEGGVAEQGVSAEAGGTTEQAAAVESGGAVEQGVATETGRIVEPGVATEGGAVEQGARAEAGSAVEQGTRAEAIVAAGEATTQSEQPTEIQTEPASATAERVQEQAGRVENIIGEPPEEVAQVEGEQQEREQDGEGAGALATEAVVRSGETSGQPEQPTGLVTEPAAAPAERVLERADQVESIIGTSSETGGEEAAPEAAPEAVAAAQPEAEVSEGSAVAQPIPETVGGTAEPGQPEQPTGLVTEPASAPAERVMERADQVESVVGRPPEEVGRSEAVARTGEPVQPEAPEREEDQGEGAGRLAVEEGVRSAVQQAPVDTTGTPPAPAASEQPEQPTQIVTPPASEAAGQTLEQADVVGHVVGEPAEPNEVAAAPVATAETAAPAPATPEQEITGQAATPPEAAQAAGAQPQSAEAQTPQEVVTISSETGEVVSQPADAGKKTFADVAAEAPVPTEMGADQEAGPSVVDRDPADARVATDKSNVEPSETDREMAAQREQQEEQVGDLGLGRHGAHDRIAEHLVAGAFAAPSTTAAASAAATHSAAAATAAQTVSPVAAHAATAVPPAQPANLAAHGVAGPAINRNRRAAPARNLSQQPKQTPPRVKKEVANTAPASSNPTTAARRKAEAAVAAKPKRAAPRAQASKKATVKNTAGTQKVAPAKTATANPRRVPAAAVRTANRQKPAANTTQVPSQQQRQAQKSQAMLRRERAKKLRSLSGDLEPGPE